MSCAYTRRAGRGSRWSLACPPSRPPPRSRATRRSARDPVQARHGERAAARARAAGSRLRPAWVRDPAIVVSNRARRRVVHDGPFEHTSTLKMIEFNLRAAPAAPGTPTPWTCAGSCATKPGTQSPPGPHPDQQPSAGTGQRRRRGLQRRQRPVGSLHPPYPRTRGSPGCVPGRSPGIQPEPGWGNWHAATARGQPGRHHPGRLASRGVGAAWPAVIALATRGNQAAAPLAVGRPPECGSGPGGLSSRRLRSSGGCLPGAISPRPGVRSSHPAGWPGTQAPARRSLLPASPATRLLPCRLCTNMWITCAQRRRACAYAVEMLGIPLPGRNHERAFTWENASSILCIQRKPELSTCRAVIDNK